MLQLKDLKQWWAMTPTGPGQAVDDVEATEYGTGKARMEPFAGSALGRPFAQNALGKQDFRGWRVWNCLFTRNGSTKE